MADRRLTEIQRLARTVCPGAVVERTSGNHYRVRIMGPQGTRVVTVSGTTSDHRAAMNSRADLRRAARDVGLVDA